MLSAAVEEERVQTRAQQGPEHAQELHLLVAFYAPPTSRRREELARCLAANIRNPLITHVHIFTEELLDLNKVNGSSEFKIQTFEARVLGNPKTPKPHSNEKYEYIE